MGEEDDVGNEPLLDQDIDLARLGGPAGPAPAGLRLSELLREDLVKLSLSARGKWAAVSELLEAAVAAGEVERSGLQEVLAAVREEESIRSSGWKDGVAVPFGRPASIRCVTAVLGVSRYGIDFGCRDGLPAHLIVLLLIPGAHRTRYAGANREIASLFEDPQLRGACLSARRPGRVVEAVEDAESWEII